MAGFVSALAACIWREQWGILVGILMVFGNRIFPSSRNLCRWCVLLFRAISTASILLLISCDAELGKSDAELGLNPQQVAGRHIYDKECGRCHEPYSTKGKKGPGFKGIFRNPYLSLSGLPANDERVTDIIRLGRNEMPAYNQKLNSGEIADLLAYLHTL